MRILVDADACPVKGIITALAKKYNIPVTMVIDTSHILKDDYAEIITVDCASDSADLKLMNLCRGGDIVVTQDYGVAAMALGRGASAIHQNGMLYTDETIDALLFSRYAGQKLRRCGGRTKGPKKRTSTDDMSFYAAFESLLAGLTDKSTLK